MLIECYVVTTLDGKPVTKVFTQLSTANAKRNSYNRWNKQCIAVTKKFMIDTEQGEVMYDKNYTNS